MQKPQAIATRFTLLTFLCSTLMCSTLMAAAHEVLVQVPYVPTPPDVVSAMLKLANPHKGDVLYDLGCGDGRIVVAAAKQYGLHAVGVDINPERIKEANENAAREGVANLVKFQVGDLYEADLKGASIVTLYLLPDVNLKLRPKLQRELKPGARIVSHSFDMGDWKADKEETIESKRIFLWVLPTQSRTKAAAAH